MKHRRIQLMGTTIDLTVEHVEADKVLDELVKLLHVYNKRFSANDSQSGQNPWKMFEKFCF